MISTIFAVAIALFGVIGSSHPFEKRQGNDSTWGLYAYGDHIGGLPVFFADGRAEIGDISLSNATNKFPVVFSNDGNKTTWIAHPDTSKANNIHALFTTEGISSTANLIALGNTGNLASPVIFTPLNGTSSLNGTTRTHSNDQPKTDGGAAPFTDVWRLYGQIVILSHPNASFYAKPTGKDNWYILLWSSTVSASLGNTPVAVETGPPATIS